MARILTEVSFGLAFIGDRFSEVKLIKYAYAYEQNTMIHKMGKTTYLGEIRIAEKGNLEFIKFPG